MEQFGRKVRDERWRSFGHVLKRNSGYAGQKDVGDGVAKKKEKRKSVDVVKKDMETWNVKSEEAEMRCKVETNDLLFRPLKGTAE